ncbi:flagellar filament capping protein FliD [Alicyclobacillus hesperidum]|uniref:flagellar filament capping protein FliD n=1 Tax=Alicyclobacillus hesperidum TaxID=89784 RepID=UPI002491F5A9|nr:flagellar filament capping protein FliD [Alicyclobacillus hesperidum]
MSISSTSSNSMANLLQQLNTLSNPSGTGLPVSQYAQDLQRILTQELETPSNNELSQLSSQQTALTGLQTALQTFEQATETLSSLQSWSTVTGTSSDPTSFTVTVQPGAQPAMYSLQVTSLASSQTSIQNLSSQFQTSADGSSNLSSGTIVLTNTVNSSKTATINVSTGESLNDIAAAINQQTSTTGVQASVLTNGQNQYFLSLSSVNTGTANGFTISGSLIGSGTGQIQFATTNATDASITLDGQTMTSSTNTFQNYIPNVTIQVSQTMSSAGTLTLSTDASGAEKAVQTWMTAYNTLMDTINKDTAYTPPSAGSSSTQGTAGPLFGDPLAMDLLRQLPAAVSASISTSSSAINSLASIGIVIDPSNGHLEFQSTSGFSSAAGTLPDGQSMFESALSSDPTAVQQLFGVVSTTASTAIPQSGVLGNVYNLMNNLLLGNSSGSGTSPIEGELNAISAQQTSIQNYLNLVQQQITNQVNNYTNQLNQLNSVMEQAQAQMKQISAMFGTSASSSSGGIL